MSASCQKATFALQQIFLFDHLVGAGEERRWHSNAKRIGGFHIYDQLETSWLLDRQIGGLGALEDFFDVHSTLSEKGRLYRGVPHQPPLVHETTPHRKPPRA